MLVFVLGSLRKPQFTGGLLEVRVQLAGGALGVECEVCEKIS